MYRENIDWLDVFYYLFLCLSDDASWSKYVQDVGEVIWFTGTAVTRGCWRVWSRLGLSQSFSLRGNISNAVDKECICEIKGFHRERCVKVWYRKYHQALPHWVSLSYITRCKCCCELALYKYNWSQINWCGFILHLWRAVKSSKMFVGFCLSARFLNTDHRFSNRMKEDGLWRSSRTIECVQSSKRKYAMCMVVLHKAH